MVLEWPGGGGRANGIWEMSDYHEQLERARRRRRIRPMRPQGPLASGTTGFRENRIRMELNFMST